MTDTSTAISAAPWIALAQPYVNVLAQIAIGAAVTYGAALYHRWTGLTIGQAKLDQAQAEAEKQAGIIIAHADDNLAGKSIGVSNPQILAATNYVASVLPGVLASAHLSADDFSHMVLAEIGKLQAQAPTVSTTPAPAKT